LLVLGDREPVDRQPGDVLTEVVEALDERRPAEQVGEDACLVGGERRGLADGVGVVLVEDQQVATTRVAGDHPIRSPLSQTNSCRSPTPGRLVSLISAMSTSLVHRSPIERQAVPCRT
jgi:hypothetical protein